MASPSSVLTLGFGSWGSSALVVTLGFGSGEVTTAQATLRTGILIGSDRHLHTEGSNRREQLDGTARRGELKQ